jgi:Ca-activated chloride channel family protein
VAGKRLKDLKAKARILVLLTDGRHNAGDITPLQAAAAVRALGIKVYAIGVGGKGPAPFRVDTMFGPRVAYQEVDLDEETLTKVAQEGGGKYFRAADSKRLSEIYDIIDREEKSEVDVKEFFHFRELYPYFLIPALVLLGLEIVLSVTIFRVIP